MAFLMVFSCIPLFIGTLFAFGLSLHRKGFSGKVTMIYCSAIMLNTIGRMLNMLGTL